MLLSIGKALLTVKFLLALQLAKRKGDNMKKLIVKFPNDAEYDQLKIDAHQHNCNLSEYIRYLVAKEREDREK